jgi:hypothetical protein
VRRVREALLGVEAALTGVNKNDPIVLNKTRPNMNLSASVMGRVVEEVVEDVEDMIL